MQIKIYKTQNWAKIFSGFSSLFFIIGALFFLIYNKEASALQRTIIVLGIPIAIIGPYPIYCIRIFISEKEITISPSIIPRSGGLMWNEIAEVKSEYFLFPETGIINLIPNHSSGKTFIRVSIFGMPIDLVKDILSHLPPDTKIYLYPYLKRKVEGKQTWFYKK